MDERGRGHGRTITTFLMSRLHRLGVRNLHAVEKPYGFLGAVGFTPVRCETISQRTFDLPGLTAARRLTSILVATPERRGANTAVDRGPTTLSELIQQQTPPSPRARRPKR